MNKLLSNEERNILWNKSKEIIEKISHVISVEKITVLGSFTTSKQRPADVDFIILLTTKDKDEKWSTDIVFAPNNEHGHFVIEDARLWMEEKYGKDGFTMFEYNETI